MKTTLDIKDELFTRAKSLAERTGRPLRAVVEEGLGLVLAQQSAVSEFKLEDRSVDARIAALCLAHGVEELLTKDRDFYLFPELVTRVPTLQ